MKHFYCLFDSKFAYFYEPFLAESELEAKQFVFGIVLSNPGVSCRISDLSLFDLGYFTREQTSSDSLFLKGPVTANPIFSYPTPSLICSLSDLMEKDKVVESEDCEKDG